MSRNELVDLTLAILHETDAAILVSDDGTEKRAVWVPRSQVEIERLKPKRWALLCQWPLPSMQEN